MPKTQMAHAVHWRPFCEEKPYKSKENLNNHMEQNYEPQTLRICLECCGNWNTDLGRSRHVRRVGCSGRQFESARHEMRKSLYGCGVCARLFDDFGIRQDHLFNHQQSGVPKAAWSMDNVMRALLSHHSISGAWTDSCQAGSIQLDHLEDLHWDWTKATAVEVLTALEHKRFDDQELRVILDKAISSLILPDVEATRAAATEFDFDAFMQQLQDDLR